MRLPTRIVNQEWGTEAYSPDCGARCGAAQPLLIWIQPSQTARRISKLGDLILGLRIAEKVLLWKLLQGVYGPGVRVLGRKINDMGLVVDLLAPMLHHCLPPAKYFSICRSFRPQCFFNMLGSAKESREAQTNYGKISTIKSVYSVCVSVWEGRPQGALSFILPDISLVRVPVTAGEILAFDSLCSTDYAPLYPGDSKAIARGISALQ